MTREGEGLTWAQVEAIAPTFIALVVVHFALGAIWTVGRLPRIGMHTASYVGLLVLPWVFLCESWCVGGVGLMEEQKRLGVGERALGSMAGRRATKPDLFNFGWLYVREGGVYAVPNKF
jgi:hypothetical protein